MKNRLIKWLLSIPDEGILWELGARVCLFSLWLLCGINWFFFKADCSNWDMVLMATLYFYIRKNKTIVNVKNNLNFNNKTGLDLRMEPEHPGQPVTSSVIIEE